MPSEHQPALPLSGCPRGGGGEPTPAADPTRPAAPSPGPSEGRGRLPGRRGRGPGRWPRPGRGTDQSAEAGSALGAGSGSAGGARAGGGGRRVGAGAGARTGLTDGRTDRRTERRCERAAWTRSNVALARSSGDHPRRSGGCGARPRPRPMGSQVSGAGLLSARPGRRIAAGPSRAGPGPLRAGAVPSRGAPPPPAAPRPAAPRPAGAPSGRRAARPSGSSGAGGGDPTGSPRVPELGGSGRGGAGGVPAGLRAGRRRRRGCPAPLTPGASCGHCVVPPRHLRKGNFPAGIFCCVNARPQEAARGRPGAPHPRRPARSPPAPPRRTRTRPLRVCQESELREVGADGSLRPAGPWGSLSAPEAGHRLRLHFNYWLDPGRRGLRAGRREERAGDGARGADGARGGSGVRGEPCLCFSVNRRVGS